MKNLFVFCSALFFTSCVSLYMPTTQNVPVFEKKGDFQSNFTLNNYQASYALTNHFAIQANAQTILQTFITGYYRDFFNRQITMYYYNAFDFAGGYYKTFNKKINFSVFGGSGLIKTKISENDYFSSLRLTNESTYNYSLIKSYFQPSISYFNEKRSISCSFRITNIYANKILGGGGRIAPLISNNGWVFVYEPCLTFKEQFDSVLGFFIQVSTPFTNPVNTDIVHPLKVRFGLTIRV